MQLISKCNSLPSAFSKFFFVSHQSRLFVFHTPFPDYHHTGLYQNIFEICQYMIHSSGVAMPEYRASPLVQSAFNWLQHSSNWKTKKNTKSRQNLFGLQSKLQQFHIKRCSNKVKGECWFPAERYLVMHILQQIPDNQLSVLSLYEILGAGREYDFHQLSPWLQSMPLGMEALQQLVPLHYVLQDSVDLLNTHHKETQLQRAKRNSWQRQTSRWQFYLLVIVFRKKGYVFSLLETITAIITLTR